MMSSSSRPSKRLTSALAALTIYQLIAILWFGLPVLRDFSHNYIGIQSSFDPGAHMWFLAWWPYALAHRLNPFITKMVWAPSGFNLTWATSIPFPALLAVPITRIWGSVATWNVLCLAAPAMAAWCAFILCRHICGSFLPAMAGGYVFGFSPYMLAHLLGHLCLILIFPVPLSLYLVVLRLERRLSAPAFVALLTIVATTLFLCSEEIFATSAIFGVFLIIAALLFAVPGSRRNLLETSALTAATLCITAVLLSPFLYYLFYLGFPQGPINSAQVYSSDLVAFVVPNFTLLTAELRPTTGLAKGLSGGAAEDTAYLGIPMIALILAYGFSNWRKPSARLLLLMLAIIALASMGPTLHIAGAAKLTLPWAISVWLPLVDKALPARFMMFAFLDAALIVALYLAAAPGRVGSILAVLVLLSLIPDFPGRWWRARVDTPRFFRDGTYKQHIGQGETALIFPYGNQGNSMLWQAQNDMYFRMAGGYLGLTPPEFERWPVLNTLYSGQPCFNFVWQLRFFLAAHDVKTIILAQDARRSWPPLLAKLNLTATTVEDVTVYNVPRELLKAYAGVTAAQAQSAADNEAFGAMIVAANNYRARGFPLAKLNPWEAARLGLLALPANSTRFDEKNPQWWQNLWLGEYGESTVGVGTLGEYAGIRTIIEKYRDASKEIFFPYPEKFRGPLPGDINGQLLMTFDQRSLDRAAALAASPTPQHQAANPG
jgi:hypothetical protein